MVINGEHLEVNIIVHIKFFLFQVIKEIIL